jgi:hypothetical protein
MKYKTTLPTSGACKVEIPVEAHAFKSEQNALRKKTPNLRLFSLEEIVWAMIEAGLSAGNWQEIALRNAEQITPLKPRARQEPKKRREKK